MKSVVCLVLATCAAPLATAFSAGRAFLSKRAATAAAARPAFRARGSLSVRMATATPKKIVVLGGDGFCGWPTALHLSDEGHEVRQLCDDGEWR
jgi:UDP-sulfoquinovose synthase